MEEEKNIPQENTGTEELKTKCEEYLNGWKRAKADFINYQKDEAKRFEEFAKFANASLVHDLIAVLDSFDLALAGPEAEKGMRIIRTQLEDIVKKYGLQKIETKPGDAFDPALHESIAEEPGEAAGTIAEVLRTGYTIHHKVIRAAQVKVYT